MLVHLYVYVPGRLCRAGGLNVPLKKLSAAVLWTHMQEGLLTGLSFFVFLHTTYGGGAIHDYRAEKGY